MIDQPFRRVLPQYTDRLIALYKSLGLTPNQISIASVFIALGATTAVAQGWIWSALILWWAGRLFDGTDGIYARATGQASPFGAYLDIVCDMASYSMMVIGFSYLYPHMSFAWLLMLLGYVLCITSALAMGHMQNELKIANHDNRGLRLAMGLAEGGETGIAYSAFLLLPGYIDQLVWLWLAILAITVTARTWLSHQTYMEWRKLQSPM